MPEQSLARQAVGRDLLKEHLTVYFKYIDEDYKDLKRILGMDPLEVTVLKCGTFGEYRRRARLEGGRPLRRMNPSPHEVRGLLHIHEQELPLIREVTR